MQLLRRIALSLLIALAAIGCGGSSQITASPSAAATGDAISGDESEPLPTSTAQAAAPIEPSDDAEPTTGADATAPGADQAAIDRLPEPNSPDARALFGAGNLTEGLSTEETACALTALTAAPELLARTLDASDPSMLSLEDQTALAVIAFDCAPETVAASFSDSFETDQINVPPEVSGCLIESMGASNPNRLAIIGGFAALNAGQAPATDARTPVIDTMVQCFPGTVIAESVAVQATNDPLLGDALDIDCLGTELDGEGMRPIWELMVDNPAVEFDDLDPAAIGPLYELMFTCLSIGQITAAQTAATGVELSEESIACIDEQATDFDVTTIDTDEGAAQLVLIMIGCLTPEELAAFGS